MGGLDSADESQYPGFERRMRSSVTGRRLITTKRGYLGLVNDGTRPGDQVCIFLGCRMPVMLRPMGEHFLFLGECYIHGLMFGEAMEALQAGEHSLRDFVLD